ncbi:hypothetical protein CEXT_730441 [Caerostris extrusa]|uniref:Uncharacterized protein n=1 Tax=Caerostris extrusa TaxID=172846 RepID=A0AAV4NCR9_CAEEX|nr:hypothetical protein CEXT_730441 [Caerostris extrusa]
MFCVKVFCLIQRQEEPYSVFPTRRQLKRKALPVRRPSLMGRPSLSTDSVWRSSIALKEWMEEDGEAHRDCL